MRRKTLGAAALLALLAVTGCKTTTAEWQPLPARYVSGAPGQLPFGPDDREALDHDRIASDTSTTLADLFVHAPYGLMFVIAAVMAFRHRKRGMMEAASNPTAPLVDGPSVVFGTVERDPSWNGPVIRLDVEQSGSEWQHKGAWHHRWAETRRTLHKRPFVVVRDDGVRVQVDPDDRVVVCDEPDIVRHSYAMRTRVASIEPGQRVHVSGVLEGAALASPHTQMAYRGAQGMPTMRAPGGDRMVISNEAPGEATLKRMRFHRNWAIGFAAVFAFCATVVMPAFELLSFTGDTVWATPVAVRDWREWHKPRNSAGYWVNRWSVRATWDDHGTPRTVEDDCGEAYHQCVVSGACAQVPYVVSSVAPHWHQIGRYPQLTVGRAVVLGILALILLITYPATVFSSRPWYMKKRVVDGGSGRLENSRP